MGNLKTSKNPLNEMNNALDVEKKDIPDFKIKDIKMPEIEVNINKTGVEGFVSPVSDKPLRNENQEWFRG